MHNHGKHEHHHHLDTEATDIPVDRMAVCPVTSGAADTAEAERLGHFRDVDGKRVYLCCATCVHLFDDDPEKYLHASLKVR